MENEEGEIEKEKRNSEGKEKGWENEEGESVREKK